MRLIPHNRSKRHARTGVRKGAIMAMELLLILPLMMAIFFGTVEYGLLLAAEARLFNASREGARVAAAGGDSDDVEAAVKAALIAREAELVDIQSLLTDDNDDPLKPGDQVAVMVSAPATTLVPDFLRFIGISISNRCLIGQTVMRKE